MKNIDKIIEKVRALRDSDNHVCQADQLEHKKGVGECSCGGYDEVIDDLETLKAQNL